MLARAGEHNGVTVFDDYGHHPVEIAAVLSAARKVTKGKVIAVMQPHRYTRLSSLFNEFCSCFNDADSVVLAPVSLFPSAWAPSPWAIMKLPKPSTCPSECAPSPVVVMIPK